MSDNPSDRGVQNDILKLRLQEKLVLPYASSTRKVDIQGSVIYDNLSTDNSIIFYSDGTQWRPVGGSLESIPDVTLVTPAPPGTIVYNELDNSLYYSDGVSWNLVESGGNETLEQTLVAGNTTGVNDIIISTGAQIEGETVLTLEAPGTATLRSTGADLILESSDAASLTSTGATLTLESLGTSTLRSTGADLILESSDAASLTSTGATLTLESLGDAALRSTGANLTLESPGTTILRSTGAGVSIIGDTNVGVSADSIGLSATAGVLNLAANAGNNISGNSVGISSDTGIQLMADDEVVVEDRITSRGASPSVDTGTIAVDSTNIAGQITGWNSGTPTLTLTYSGGGYSAGITPTVVLMPTSANSIGVLYISASTNISFTVTHSGGAGTLEFFYHVIGISP